MEATYHTKLTLGKMFTLCAQTKSIIAVVKRRNFRSLSWPKHWKIENWKQHDTYEWDWWGPCKKSLFMVCGAASHHSHWLAVLHPETQRIIVFRWVFLNHNHILDLLLVIKRESYVLYILFLLRIVSRYCKLVIDTWIKLFWHWKCVLFNTGIIHSIVRGGHL